MELQFHIKPKGEDGSAQVAELIRELQASGDPAVVGHLPKVRAAVKAALWSPGDSMQRDSCGLSAAQGEGQLGGE